MSSVAESSSSPRTGSTLFTNLAEPWRRWSHESRDSTDPEAHRGRGHTTSLPAACPRISPYRAFAIRLVHTTVRPTVVDQRRELAHYGSWLTTRSWISGELAIWK